MYGQTTHLNEAMYRTRSVRKSLNSRLPKWTAFWEYSGILVFLAWRSQVKTNHFDRDHLPRLPILSASPLLFLSPTRIS